MRSSRRYPQPQDEGAPRTPTVWPRVWQLWMQVGGYLCVLAVALVALVACVPACIRVCLRAYCTRARVSVPSEMPSACSRIRRVRSGRCIERRI